MRVHIDPAVWHLDVDSAHPSAVAGGKGSAVRRLKCYVSWVQYVVRQYGSYLLEGHRIKVARLLSTKGLEGLNLLCTSCGYLIQISIAG